LQVPSPVTQKLSVLNFALIVIAASLVLWITRIWTHPPYPLRIDGSGIVGTPKNSPELSVTRQTYPSSTLPRISEKNLFRKERAEFKVPGAEVQNVSIPQLPPPVLKIKGILLLQGVQIAVMEGTYSVLNEAGAVESKNLKKRGYLVGDYIGDYQIALIDRNEVVLGNKTGTTVKFKLERRPSATPIQREANNFFYRPARGAPKPEPQPTPAPAPTVKEPTPAPSPAAAAIPAPPIPAPTPVPAPAPPAHVSGQPVAAAAMPSVFISGAAVTPVPVPRISGQ
jgi:hypothetical protein